MGQKPTREETFAEIERITRKMQESDDEDIRAALQLRLGYLNENLPTEDEAPEEVSADVPEHEPTDADLVNVERLDRNARVEIMRENYRAAIKFAEEALALAPKSVSTLEIKGDALAALGRTGEAREVFAKAKELAPTNADVERKFAEAVLKTSDSYTIEEQLASALSDSVFIMPEDQVASGNTATILNVFLPGLGHIVLGKTAVGLGYLGSWIVLVLWLFFRKDDVRDLIRVSFGRGPSDINAGVLVPLFLLIVLYIAAIASLSKPKHYGSRSGADHPKPPVDLPFE